MHPFTGEIDHPDISSTSFPSASRSIQPDLNAAVDRLSAASSPIVDFNVQEQTTSVHPGWGNNSPLSGLYQDTSSAHPTQAVPPAAKAIGVATRSICRDPCSNCQASHKKCDSVKPCSRCKQRNEHCKPGTRRSRVYAISPRADLSINMEPSHDNDQMQAIASNIPAGTSPYGGNTYRLGTGVDAYGPPTASHYGPPMVYNEHLSSTIAFSPVCSPGHVEPEYGLSMTANSNIAAYDENLSFPPNSFEETSTRHVDNGEYQARD
ncbi:hypothetical protein ONZ51_g10063 [Trametes cubensis]|uniref:Zn(2)-C6 fungal-type domain-containing protein n=1 Tax=Trametes cubensis TaxID=1111947 RepID=A0AAD7X6S5_9APHY|nr:hypothetical protein ONZ51_g10063 [Trametes cubensis]